MTVKIPILMKYTLRLFACLCLFLFATSVFPAENRSLNELLSIAQKTDKSSGYLDVCLFMVENGEVEYKRKAYSIYGKLCISENTVETYRKNLMLKFGAKNSTDLVVKALASGYLTISI